MLCNHMFAFADVPKFDQIESSLANTTYSGVVVDSSKSLTYNVKCLLIPSENVCAQISYSAYDIIKTIAITLLFLYLVIIGITFIFEADKEASLKKQQRSIGFIVYGLILIFGADLVFSQISLSSATDASEIVKNTNTQLLATVITLLKNTTYYIALLMIIYFGYRILQSSDSESKAKQLRTGVMNILVALVFIKLYDILFVIATQQSFRSDLSDLLINGLRILGWGIGAIAVVMIIYGGIVIATSRGDDGLYKKGIATIRNSAVVIITLIVIILLLYWMLGPDVANRLIP